MWVFRVIETYLDFELVLSLFLRFRAERRAPGALLCGPMVLTCGVIVHYGR